MQWPNVLMGEGAPRGGGGIGLRDMTGALVGRTIMLGDGEMKVKI